ncbi:MAG TPA: DUF4097 family beta strand repeat-containing protein [Spirochaetota bacterium]|nr:DUF4097 family beta strand repeat-containing protein [Spirochaetota bacterium]
MRFFLFAVLFFIISNIYSLENKIDKVAEPKESIYIKIADGSLKIKSWDKNQVYIKGYYEKNIDRLIVNEDSDKIEIKTEISKKNLESKRNIKCNLEIFAPERRNLKLDFSNAAVEIVGNFNNANINSTSGEIKIDSNLENIELFSINGNIEAQGSAKSFLGTTISGNFNINGSFNTLNLKSSSGDIIVNESAIKDMNIFNTNGNIKINLPKFDSANCEIVNVRGKTLFSMSNPRDIEITIKSIKGKSKINKNNFDSIQNDKKILKLKKGENKNYVFIETMTGEIEIQNYK